MNMKRKRRGKRVGMILLVLFLFWKQSMFLAAKTPEIPKETESLEKGELPENKIIELPGKKEVSEILEQDESFFPYYSDMEELLVGIREKLATSEENFIMYVPYRVVEDPRFNGLLKQLFPAVRTGNYYSSTVRSISISSIKLSSTGEAVAKLNVEVKRTDSREEQIMMSKKVEEICGSIEKYATNDYEKIKMAHDYLIQKVEYVDGYDGAYSALYLGKAVCNGYAAAFQLMMEELKIPCMMVCSNEMNHVWNCVYLEGDWYNMDVTWDDSKEETDSIYYKYFLKAKEDFCQHDNISFSTAEKSFVQNTTSLKVENGWKQKENESYYYMEGKLVTGWLFEQEYWYYLGKDGAMQTGWIKSAGKWYYLGKDGAMQTGWIKSAGKWYYLGKDGAMQTGWIKSVGEWYYLGKDGVMQTGFIKIDGISFFLNDEGILV